MTYESPPKNIPSVSGAIGTRSKFSTRHISASPSPLSGIKASARPPLFFILCNMDGSNSTSSAFSESIRHEAKDFQKLLFFFSKNTGCLPSSFAARINRVWDMPRSRQVAKYCLNGADSAPSTIRWTGVQAGYFFDWINAIRNWEQKLRII